MSNENNKRSTEDGSAPNDDGRVLTRRGVLRTTGMASLAIGAPGLAAADSSSADTEITDASRAEIRNVVHTEGFREVDERVSEERGRSRRRGDAGSVRSEVDLQRAAVLEKANETGYVLAAPLTGDDSFEPLDSTTGLRAHYADGSANVIFNAGGEVSADAMNSQSSTIPTVSTQADCRFSWVPGYYCEGVYDTETICTIIGGVNAFIVGNDATGIGFVDDVLIPFTASAGAACGAEQFAELVVADWLGGCDSTNWEYELYYSRWWNPGPSPVVAPRCS